MPLSTLLTLHYLQLDRGASAPAARGGHATASIGSKVICFGGADRSPTPFSDLWELDTGTRLFLNSSEEVVLKPKTSSCMFIRRLRYRDCFTFQKNFEVGLRLA